MLKKLLLILCITSYCSISAQVLSNDISSIKETVENYYNGYVHRDSVKLYRAFDHINGVMKVPTKDQKGEDYVKNVYFKDLLPRWYGREKLSQDVLDNSELRILNIDVAEGIIGSAKIYMKVGEDIYIDILSLQKINEVWKITNKIYMVMSD